VRGVRADPRGGGVIKSLELIGDASLAVATRDVAGAHARIAQARTSCDSVITVLTMSKCLSPARRRVFSSPLPSPRPNLPSCVIITHCGGRKSWHGLRHRFQADSHALRVVAFVFAGSRQNLLGLHGGQVCRRWPGLKRNAHVIRRAMMTIMIVGVSPVVRLEAAESNNYHYSDVDLGYN